MSRFGCASLGKAVRFFSIFAALMGTFAVSHTAHAAVPPALRPTNKPMFAVFAMGPTIDLSDSITQFKISQEFGYHLFGGGTGPAIGASMQESFGKGIIGFQIGPRFWWDFQPFDGLGLYIAPVAQMGYALYANGSTSHFFNFQFGVEPRLVIADIGILYFRFFTIDIKANKDFVPVNYDMMFGGGVVF